MKNSSKINTKACYSFRKKTILMFPKTFWTIFCRLTWQMWELLEIVRPAPSSNKMNVNRNQKYNQLVQFLFRQQSYTDTKNHTWVLKCISTAVSQKTFCESYLRNTFKQKRGQRILVDFFWSFCKANFIFWLNRDLTPDAKKQCVIIYSYFVLFCGFGTH